MFSTQVELFDTDGYKIYRIPDIVVTQSGAIVVCYECRRDTTSDWAAMDIGLRRSTDGGRTWSERFIPVKSTESDTAHNPILFADHEILHMVWHKNYCHSFSMYSLDDGVTWSEPREITYAYEALRKEYDWTVIAAGPGHGLVTSGGRLIVPVWLASNHDDPTAHRPSVLSTLFSDDRGKTWRCGEILWSSEDFVNPSESLLAELKDGSFMINCRHETDGKYRKVAFSPDGISGWHDLHTERQLNDPICAAGLVRGEDKLYFVNCNSTREEGRRNLTLRCSSDDGKTWEILKTICEEGGYSDIAYDADHNCLYILAECGHTEGAASPWSFGLSFFSVPL